MYRGDKTKSSLEKLDAVVKAAEAVEKNADASPADIAENTDAVNKALKGLVENSLPEINAEDKIITVGSLPNLKDGVSASDKEDKKIELDKISVESNLPTDGSGKASKVGNYEATYSVTDSDGGKGSKTVKITVNAADKSALNKAIERGEAADKTGKTKATISALEKALSEGRKTAADENAYPEAVEAAVKNINDAVNGLKKNTAPVINVSDRVITVGTEFNPMDGVTATDADDGTISADKIRVTGSVPVDASGKANTVEHTL